MANNKNNKQRLFEVMSRLDKTFTPKLNEGFEEIESTDGEVSLDGAVDTPAEMGAETPVEKTPEEKLAELTAKVDELYGLIHGEESADAEVDLPPEEAGDEEPPVEVEIENLQEWNFDKKKGDKKDVDADDKKSDDDKEEDLDEAEEPTKKAKVPVEAVAKVGK